jgi:chromosome segregation ATPase
MLQGIRVRLDQAGDNAYYLGLLFTLISMAFALYDFSRASSAGRDVFAAEQIIGNFGVALASTIAGIFLRVILHQMRLDPADVEGQARLELSLAASQVRAKLNNVSLDFAGFHDELRQRTSDVLAHLVKETSVTLGQLVGTAGSTTNRMIEQSTTVHQEIVQKTVALTQGLTEMATEAQQAAERLRNVKTPPVTLAKRLQELSDSLETIKVQAEQIVSTLGAASSEVTASTRATQDRMESFIKTVELALQAVSDRAVVNKTAIDELGARTRQLAEESALAQGASVEVLRALSDTARRLEDVARKSPPPLGA